jgi:hypothetical protein
MIVSVPSRLLSERLTGNDARDRNCKNGKQLFHCISPYLSGLDQRRSWSRPQGGYKRGCLADLSRIAVPFAELRFDLKFYFAHVRLRIAVFFSKIAAN